MQYCDWSYLLLFLPIVMIIYSVVPKKKRYIFLFLVGLIFFYLISETLIVYLFVTIFITYGIGLWLKKLNDAEEKNIENLEKEEKKKVRETFNKKKRMILFLGIALELTMLCMTKYLSFMCLNVNNLLELFHASFRIKEIKIFAPIGISFYTLQSISYMVDVYRLKFEPNNNILKVGLYLSFFPQIMEGPISRYDDVKDNLFTGENLKYQNICFGTQRIMYGFIKKMVVADRLNSTVALIFNNYSNYNGGIIFIGAILYTIQLYMDFSGIMDIVIGSGEIFNVKLPENFKQPFFSSNISDFWSRWHITLGTWFKDYIFYPISLSKFSRKMTCSLRKKIGNHFGPLAAGALALFAVWFSNGLWHGAGYSFLFFGMYHFVLILLGNIFSPVIKKFYEFTKIDKDKLLFKSIRIIKTTIIVIIGELFFRASTLTDGINMFKLIVSNFSLQGLTDGTLLKIGLDGKDYIIIGVTLLIVFVIGVLKEKGIYIREEVSKKPLVVRWCIYYMLILYGLIFGAYLGPYTPIDPMYASF